MWKETYEYEKRPISVKRDLYMWKNTNKREKIPIYDKKPISLKRDLYMWKETYTFGKRPINVNRDLW